MTEAGADRWRVRGRGGKMARAREEWSEVSGEKKEEREEKREGIFHHEVSEENRQSCTHNQYMIRNYPTPLYYSENNEKPQQRASKQLIYVRFGTVCSSKCGCITVTQ